ncbi:MAG: cyclic nucleotide-binding domain-containing protein [Desulfobulbaceae bacterium]|nr:cyclic nucleotide-binding domain-containing protein [Desulfobulbaceae bacterium]
MVKDKLALSIIQGLTKGTITINRVEEYKKLLTEYPDDPFVNRLFADFLKNAHSFANAINRYRKTYDLFMAEGETLHAIAALLELWEIISPAPYDFRSLHSKLRRKDSHNSVIDEFFAKMSYPELRATISQVEKIQVKADEIVQNLGEPEDSFFFVISGELLKTPVDSENDEYGVVQLLRENDHFGDYFPWKVKRAAPYQVKAKSDTELLKISKENCLNLFEKHPNLKNGIKKLIKYQLIPDEEKPDKFFRKTSRRNLAISLSLEIIDPQPGRHPLTVKGFSRDISLGGARITVDPRYRDIPINDVIGRKAKLRVSLPDESVSVSIMGRIAWSKETEIDGHKTCALGVQFNETPPRLRGSMIIFINAVGTISPR